MRIFVIAGEPSGDRLGGALMASLRQLHPDVTFEGIGGAEMTAQGMTSLFPMQELSVMGLAEILPKYRQLKRRIAQTARAILDHRPDVLITIDSPDFCLRVAKLVKAASQIRTVHYVAPTVWAWRPGRAAKMARMIDHVLCLFPFEPPYMQDAGMRSDFVGHPVVAEPTPSADDIAAFRSTYGVGEAPVLLVLPGSRRGEVDRLCDPFGGAVDRFLNDRPDWRVIIPAAAPVADRVQTATQNWPGSRVIIDPRDMPPETAAKLKRGAFGTAQLALAASGTVSLELAASQTPMVIAYKFNALTWMILQRMIRVDTGTLVNLVSDTRTVPECFGPDCTAEKIDIALSHVAAMPDAQLDAMRVTMQRLGQGGDPPGLRAARAVLDAL